MTLTTPKSADRAPTVATLAPCKKEYSVSLLSKGQRILFILSWLPSAIVIIFYLAWWFYPSHHVFWPFSIGASYIIMYELFAPFWLHYFAVRAIKPNCTIQPLPEWRVAMVVTKAASEPWDLVRKTLIACTTQSVKHDTWLADENPSQETVKWCSSNGVQISTRFGIADYHRQNWPRRTRCKEGNLAFFYDNFGYDQYDFVSQLDADHVPTPEYLLEILRPFNNPKVGYVAAPSICNTNAETSWFARGRLYAEAALHGVQQAGYSNGYAPLCIGSHYAVRTAALKQIGGLGPELAEDHSTSLIMNAGGWKGYFAIDAIAYGEGPVNVVDGIMQEFQWSKSIAIIFLTLFPRKILKLKVGLSLQFLYAEVWYLLFSSRFLTGSIMLFLVLLFDVPMMKVNYFWFLAFASAFAMFALLPIALLRRFKILRPNDIPILSWEGPLFMLVRVPWVLLGITSAVLTVVTRKSQDWRITPKNNASISIPLPFQVISPYIIIAAVTSLIVLLTGDVQATRPYHTLTLAAAAWSLFTAGLIVALHPKKNFLNLIALALSLLMLVFIAVLRLPESIPELMDSRYQSAPSLLIHEID